MFELIEGMVFGRKVWIRLEIVPLLAVGASLALTELLVLHFARGLSSPVVVSLCLLLRIFPPTRVQWTSSDEDLTL